MTDAWGVDDGYYDATGTWRKTPAATRAAILAAMGLDPAAPRPPVEAPVRVVQPGQPGALDRPAELTLEDGTVLRAEAALPPDLPLGYHTLRPLDGGRPLRLIASPGRCYLPPGLRTWGWAVQLPALRSGASWGMGDLADLRRLARWSRADLGAGLVLVNPLHAAAPLLPQQPSPYFPSSRRYRNPLYLRIEDVPGAAALGVELEPLARAGRALNADRRIDRDAVFRLKVQALERLWQSFPGDSAFDRYCAEQGEALWQFATFCALAEHHARGWRAWPAEHRRPDAPAVARFAAARADRVRCHQWLQWLVDQQLARVGAELLLVQDLPIGVDPEGADAWAWQDVLAPGVSVGAPPDAFNARGQGWGLPPFVPHKLRSAAYEPFIQTLRATLRHAGGLRVDHIMGLFRLFWIPAGASPVEGAYVRYPADELLAILALESQRAAAFVVGEDLGTVEQGVREQLAERRILSSRVLWFESRPPADYPLLALASVTTHDLPTVAGLWSGSDFRAQQALGLPASDEDFERLRAGLRALTGYAREAEVGEVIVRVHRRLAEAPSLLLAATLEDALAVEERPNMPGTTAERPNWSLALPLPLEAIETVPRVRAVAAALRRSA
ncbi:MAG: 4-alpha-glucanotransferase [Chloroflexi bacterium]|nr:4-alpha-glucanotransferase [Chloroflexota bacterium]